MSQDRGLAGPAVKGILFLTSSAGLGAFAFSLYSVATEAINLNWVLLFLVVALSLSRVDISIPQTPPVVKVKDLFILASILLFGPMPSVVLAGTDSALSCRNQNYKRTDALISLCSTSLLVFVSGWAMTLVFGENNRQEQIATATTGLWSAGRLALAAAMLVIIYFVLRSAFDALAGAMKDGHKVVKAWESRFLINESLAYSLAIYIALAIASVAISLVADLSFNAFIISVLLVVTAYLTYKVYTEKINASNHHSEKMADLHLRTIEALAIAVDAKDEVTHDHVFRVQVYATGLAKLFGLADSEVEALRAGALLHDIGKIAVPDYILNKPGKLTPAEFEEMKMHTVIGAEILERVGFPYPVVPVVRHHHERWDGRGYPDGLKGEAIPMTARIISVVDCFDAVREDRQYRKAMTRDQAIELLKSNAGTMYDPAVVDAFVEHLPEFEAQIRSHKAIAANGKREKSSLFKPKPQGADQQVLDSLNYSHGEIESLYGVVQAIGSTLDLRDALTIFSIRLQDIVSYTTSVLYLVRRDTTEVEAVHVSGRHADLFKGRRVSSGAGITGWVVANGHPMHNSDPRLDFDAMKAPVPERYRTSTVVPVLKNGRVLGALAVYSADADTYDVDQLRMLEAVAKLMSDAIGKAGSKEAKATGELTDKVTGVANRNALSQRFEIEADRADRHGEHFSVVMMDIDEFKQVNKTLGREKADQLLWDVARVLSKIIESPSMVCRYGADKFVALLEGDPEEVIEMVRRIQCTIDKHDFGFATSNIFIGMSIGYANYGGHGRTLDELLVAATCAMTSDKANRKSVLSGPLAVKSAPLDLYKVM